jgi:hypothetical protein
MIYLQYIWNINYKPEDNLKFKSDLPEAEFT